MKEYTKWAELLKQAVEEPGFLMDAYSAFHNYSLGNQLSAMFQCFGRHIPLGPIDTYKGWQAKGRQVQKGQKALELCQPVVITRKAKDAGEDDAETEQRVQVFIWRPRWFVLSQTEGPELEFPSVPGWSQDGALQTLGITQVAFDMPDGNCQGYAKGRQIAINPVAAMPLKTFLHECAHIELGHTAQSQVNDDDRTPRNLREVEAESVALLVGSALGLEVGPQCRGYIQSWLKDQSIPEKSAQRIFGAADRILKAGREG
jgi:hypothetical protein